ncbi:nuclear transport factor 2 family protein [Spirosoma sp. BT702]|uniref:Nuclear transport factor 2 family protein n=1 Tax=Spirosoma profusum TaxID=2771354 RepID=A0A927AVV7_9BACT|nr:nuclear transport factor 2 family protein [Spirosoma profusum]MBD2705331.1 nuclear transport factor 2 family protein [Spirosoma profusum]
MTQEQALHFADEWIGAFNAHDLDAIMAHYADELEFYSPFIPLLTFNETGCITSKGDLERYFQVGLSTYPDLHFTLHHVFVGMHTMVLYYTSVNGRLASEVFQLNERGQAQKVFCHYTLDNSRVAL